LNFQTVSEGVFSETASLTALRFVVIVTIGAMHERSKKERRPYVRWGVWGKEVALWGRLVNVLFLVADMKGRRGHTNAMVISATWFL
jgi:hypothetical protein